MEKQILFAKLTDNGLELQQNCLDHMQVILEREKIEHSLFVSYLCRGESGRSDGLDSVINFFGALSSGHEDLERLEEAEDSPPGIMLTSPTSYTQSYFIKDGVLCPENAAVFILCINAPTADHDGYALMMDYCISLSSHVIYVQDSPVKVHVQLRPFRDELFVKQGNGISFGDGKLVSIILVKDYLPESTKIASLKQQHPGEIVTYPDLFFVDVGTFVLTYFHCYWEHSTIAYGIKPKIYLNKFVETILRKRSSKFLENSQGLTWQLCRERLSSYLKRSNDYYLPYSASTNRREAIWRTSASWPNLHLRCHYLPEGIVQESRRD